jgi:superfamily I DNA/RNA helicase
MFAVFTPNSLLDFMQDGRERSYLPPEMDGPVSEDSAAIVRNGNIYFAHRSDTVKTPLIFVGMAAWLEFTAQGELFHVGYDERLARFFERIDRASRALRQADISIPRNWNKYSYKNFVAFFAVPRIFNLRSYRWITEKLQDGSSCFWQVTGSDEEIRLENFEPDRGALTFAWSSWLSYLSSVIDLAPPITSAVGKLQQVVDLDLAGARQVTQQRTYSGWLSHLTPRQREIVAGESGESALKVRGQAGSGKTLTLIMRALHDVYEKIDAGGSVRILFVVHSWAMQEQIERSLSQLDERSVWREAIDVMPLPFLQESIQGQFTGGALLLGDDSLEGKRKQLRLISDSIDAVIESAGSTFRGHVGDLVSAALDASSGELLRLSLAWQFMREFVEVIDAHRLKPGANSLVKYLNLPRESWMVPLDEVGDREFTFAVYRNYVSRLVEEGQMTVDQAVSDFRGYLEGYSWNIRRMTEGYDVILVDEFHLFNDTERYVLHLLTNDPDVNPRMIVSLDPAQSPFALLTGLEKLKFSRLSDDSDEVEKAVSVELSIIHRFTRGIHRFVTHVYARMPNLVDLGADWIYSAETSSAREEEGVLPHVVFCAGSLVVSTAVGLALKENSGTQRVGRVAVLGVTSTDLVELRTYVESSNRSKSFVTMASREDIDRLAYAQKKIVLASAEYAAGLQFESVIVVSSVDPEGGARSASARRAAISQLYLAATRSMEKLICVSTTSDTVISEVLRSAIEAEVAQVHT